MKITWNENPMATTIELDDKEKEIFKLKLKLEIYEDLMFSAHWNLTRDAEYLTSLPRPQTVGQAREEAIKQLNPDYWCTDDVSPADKRVNELFEYYIADLQGHHAGDCTCVPCSCTKCHAESLLGIDTIKGLSKYAGSKISLVFSQWNPETEKHDLPPVVLEVALEKLRTYEPKANWAGYEAYVPRWKAEAKAAYKWLLAYRDQHFPKETQ